MTVEVRDIVRGYKTDPINMAKEAKKHKNTYNEICVVFDRDRERDDQNLSAILLVNKSNIRIAYSSISFVCCH